MNNAKSPEERRSDDYFLQHQLRVTFEKPEQLVYGRNLDIVNDNLSSLLEMRAQIRELDLWQRIA